MCMSLWGMLYTVLSIVLCFRRENAKPHPGRSTKKRERRSCAESSLCIMRPAPANAFMPCGPASVHCARVESGSLSSKSQKEENSWKTQNAECNAIMPGAVSHKPWVNSVNAMPMKNEVESRQANGMLSNRER